jgi:DNA invertase Pin-like site-specific DNA recombinase
MGQLIGYRRVSSVDQNTARQLEGLTLDKVFEDKVSGSTIKRPALADCLGYVREGDTLVVHSIDRLARNLADLESLVAGLNKKSVAVRFIKENLTFSGGENSMSTLMFQMLGAFAQFERSMIRERQREGIAAAKKEGRHLGRVKTLTDQQESEIKSRVASGETKKALAGEYGVSRQTIYSILGRP